jgi:WD40 repeat protein
LPQGEARANELMASFWLRRSAAAAGLGNRDHALVYAMAAVDAGSRTAAAVASNLIDGDYRRLEQSYPLSAPPLAVEVDWQRDQIVVVDESNRVHRLALGAADNRTLTTRLTALQHVGVTRGIFVDQPGRAGAFELKFTVQHARTRDLLVRLRAPSGAATEMELPQRDGNLEQFVFTASAENGLSRLADESITGQWEITLFDRLSGESGRLLNWGLGFPGVTQSWADTPVNGLPLPDPVRTEQVAVEITADGRLGIAIPARVDARGAVSVWDLTSGELLADLPLTDRADTIEWLDADRLLIVGARRATLWSIEPAESIAGFTASNRFDGRPAVSPEGRYFALAEPSGARRSISVFRVADGTRVSRVETSAWQHWVLGPDAAYIAGVDGSRRGSVIDPLTGEIVAEFFHERELERIIPTASANRIIAVDRGGEIFAWPFAPDSDTWTPRDSIYLGTSSAADSIDVAANDQGFAYLEAEGLVTVRSPVDGTWRATLEHGAGRAYRTRLAPAADRLITVTDSLIRYWQLVDEPEALRGFGDLSAVALDSRGELAVLGYRGGQVSLLPGLPASVATGGTSDAVTGHRGVVTALAVSLSGDLAASGSSDGVVRVWNTRSGARSPSVLRHPSGPIGTLAFSPDDHWLVSTGVTSARVFDLTGNMLASEIEVDGTPLAVAFSADSRLVAVGDSAGNIFIATPDGTAGVLAIRGRSPITALAFADEPELLASGSSNGDLVLWDTLTASAIEAAHRFPAPIRWIDLLPGASTINLQSGAWLHTLDRSTAVPRVVASALLPDRLRGKPALARTSVPMIRGLASTGGGHLALADLTLATADLASVADAAEQEGASTLTTRDWRRVLGIELDRATGAIRSAVPRP